MLRKPTETQRTILREISEEREHIRVVKIGTWRDYQVWTRHGVNPGSEIGSRYYIQSKTFVILRDQGWIEEKTPYGAHDEYWYITNAGRVIISEGHHA